MYVSNTHTEGQVDKFIRQNRSKTGIQLIVSLAC